MIDPTVQLLLDRQEIADLLSRYAHALDSRNWDLLRLCFTEDAVAEYLETGGINEGVEAILDACRRALSGLDSSQHLIGTVLAEVDGDTATARSYLQAQHISAEAPGGDHYLIGGSYVDRLIRKPEGWRISHRKLHASWRTGNPGVFEAAAAKLRSAGSST